MQALFEMKYLLFDRDVIDIHFQKMEKIYFRLGGDPIPKKDLISSLSRMIDAHTMTIAMEKFKSIYATLGMPSFSHWITYA